jgi:chemotaxis receptor (MCP) glutamine deamidase CheD
VKQVTFVKGQSGNPGGRKKKHIGDLSREARRYANLALNTLVKIARTGVERNRLAAANALLDRGYGRPVQAIDMITAGKKLSELTPEELAAFEARLMSAEADDAEPPAQGEFNLH